ncbi:unnamed protein product [Calypogeia fissa]
MGVQNSKGKEKILEGTGSTFVEGSSTFSDMQGAMIVNALNPRCVNQNAIHQNMVNQSSGIQSSILNGTTTSPLGRSNDARVVAGGAMNQKRRFEEVFDDFDWEPEIEKTNPDLAKRAGFGPFVGASSSSMSGNKFQGCTIKYLLRSKRIRQGKYSWGQLGFVIEQFDLCFFHFSLCLKERAIEV